MLPTRKLNRLKDYNYNKCGLYFITICTKDRKNLFWKNVGANCVRPYALSDIGLIVNNEINKCSEIYSNVKIDKYVIMPNHLHFIISINEDGRTQFAPTVSRIIKQFKGSVTKQIGRVIWQKSFYDHIIRNEKDYENTWQYINDNPLKWEEDIYFGKS